MREVALNEICDLQNGFAFKSSDYIESSNTLNCRMSNIRPEGYFDADYAPKFLPDSYVVKYKDYLLKDEDLVIAMTDMANDPKILGVPTIVQTGGKSMLLNQRVGKLIILKPSLVHVRYLQYSLNRKSVRKYYTKFAGGGLQLNVGKKQILSVKIPLPPLDQQKKIASILDAADAYRQKTKALISKYDELTQSLFLDMFGDPVGNNKGLEDVTLGELALKITTGSTPQGGKKNYTDQGVPFLRCQNVWRGFFKMDDVAYIPEPMHESLMKSSLKKGDILMTKTGRLSTLNSSLGRSAMYADEDDKANISTDVFLIRLKEGVSKVFVSYILSSDLYNDYLRGKSVGGTDKRHLYKAHLEQLKIIRPPIELQNQFAERVRAIETQKAQAQSSLEKAEDLFNSLLQKAFKGELV